MAAEGKVKYGIKRIFFAGHDGSGKYEKPWQNPGAKSVAISNGSSSSSKIPADDNPNFFVKSGASGRELEIQLTKFMRKYHTAFLGQQVDSATGALSEGPDDISKDFACGFEMTSDCGGYRVWLLSCSSELPTYTAATNTDSGITEDSETARLSASAVVCKDGKHRTMVTFETGDTGYETAFDSVPYMDKSETGSVS